MLIIMHSSNVVKFLVIIWMLRACQIALRIINWAIHMFHLYAHIVVKSGVTSFFAKGLALELHVLLKIQTLS